jgi:hypothetical protein
VQTYRDLPWPGGNAFVAKNSPIGTYVSYSIATDPSKPDSVRIEIIGSDGETYARLSGPDAKGTHRVLWDLRYQFAYVPPPADSGFYGPPKAPYVPPGEYRVRLTARGKTVEGKVQVRADSRGAGTPEGQRARLAINRRAREIDRAYFDVMNTIAVLDSTVASLKSSAPEKTHPDTLATEIATTLTTLRQRARGNSIVSGIGRLFDLTAAVESSSLPPTEMQERSLEASATDFADIVAKVNDISKKLAELGQPMAPPVKPPI